jgi:hypothetical protein
VILHGTDIERTVGAERQPERFANPASMPVRCRRKTSADCCRRSSGCRRPAPSQAPGKRSGRNTASAVRRLHGRFCHETHRPD